MGTTKINISGHELELDHIHIEPLWPEGVLLGGPKIDKEYATNFLRKKLKKHRPFIPFSGLDSSLVCAAGDVKEVSYSVVLHLNDNKDYPFFSTCMAAQVPASELGNKTLEQLVQYVFDVYELKWEDISVECEF
jgi:hypothetical protein